MLFDALFAVSRVATAVAPLQPLPSPSPLPPPSPPTPPSAAAAAGGKARAGSAGAVGARPPYIPAQASRPCATLYSGHCSLARRGCRVDLVMRHAPLCMQLFPVAPNHALFGGAWLVITR